MARFLAAQEEQEKEEIRKNEEKQLSGFNHCNKPGTSMEAEPDEKTYKKRKREILQENK